MKKFPDFLIIPHQLILDKNIKPLDRILYGVIYWLVKLKNEKCSASNQTLKELCGCKTNRGVVNSLHNLEKYGYIKRKYYDEKKRNREEIIPLISFRGVGTNDDTIGTNDDTWVGTNDEQNNKSIIIKDNNISEKKKVDNLINLFHIISPHNFKSFFEIPAERKAAGELLKKMPFDKLETLIVQILPKLSVLSYVPKDCKAFKPTELLRNLDKIIAKIRELQIKRSGLDKQIPIIK